jgi:hypothetical protein
MVKNFRKTTVLPIEDIRFSNYKRDLFRAVNYRFGFYEKEEQSNEFNAQAARARSI